MLGIQLYSQVSRHRENYITIFPELKCIAIDTISRYDIYLYMQGTPKEEADAKTLTLKAADADYVDLFLRLSCSK